MKEAFIAPEDAMQFEGNRVGHKDLFWVGRKEPVKIKRLCRCPYVYPVILETLPPSLAKHLIPDHHFVVCDCQGRLIE